MDKINQVEKFVGWRRMVEGDAPPNQSQLQEVYFSMYGQGKGSAGWFNVYFHAASVINKNNRRILEECCKKVGGEILTQKSLEVLRKHLKSDSVSHN